MNRKKAFTLIELLVVITILSVLMVSVYVALNPGKRVRDAQDGRRRSDISSILTAIHEYSVDNNGNISALGITATEKQIGTAVTGCAYAPGGSTCNVVGAADCVDLSDPVGNGKLDAYLASIPVDPNGGSATLTRYTVLVDVNGIVTVKACNANTPPITVSR